MRIPSLKAGGRLFFLFLLCLGLSILSASFSTEEQPASSPAGPISPRTGLPLKDGAVARLVHQSSGDRAHDYVSRLALWHRLQASEDYTRAAEWVAHKAGEFGLDGVAIERFPCDGKIEYFGQVMAPQWKIKKGELRLTAPFSMKLASYDEAPLSLAAFSTSADVEAEVVDIGQGTSDADFAAGVKGKVVLTGRRAAAVYGRAVTKEGAAGIVSSWSVPEFDYLNRGPGDFPDQLGWHQIPRDEAGAPGRFAFAITARRAQELRAMMRQGKTVRVRAVVDAEIVPGNLEVVSGVIPGSIRPDEEIVITAHLDHYKPGANDNASGSSAILEMARTLRELIAKKEIPPPVRTIRFMWVPEYNGTYAWLAAHLNDPVKRLANLNFDMVGENVLKTNSLVTVNYTSDSNPSCLNAIMEAVVDFVNGANGERYPARMDLYAGSLLGTRNRFSCRMAPYSTGTDHELFNNLKIGAATLGSWPDDFYHSSEDTPDKVDPTQLHRAVVIGLAGIATLAYADDGRARDLARLALLYGRKRIALSEFAAVKSVLTAAPEHFGEAGRLARNLIAHVYRRERAAVSSAAMFARTARTRSEIERIGSFLDGDEAASRKKVDDASGLRAAELKILRPPSTPTPAEQRAERLIPAREKGKELHNLEFVARTLAKDEAAQIPKIRKAVEEAVEKMQDRGEGELRLDGFADAAAFYADGRRSILEIRDAVAAEYAPLSVETLELYFRAFEKAGVMKILEK